MTASEALDSPKLKFFGLNDYGTYFQAKRASDILAQFDPSYTCYTVNEIIQLHNAAQFIENGVFPAKMAQLDRDRLLSLVPGVRKAEGVFFNGLTDSTFAAVVSGVDYTYRSDVLDFLAKFKIFDRCSPEVVLSALEADRFHVGDLLGCQALVRAYNANIRLLILSNVNNAELIISKNLLSESRTNIYLPASLTPVDCRALIDAYLDNETANPNYVQLIAAARVAKSVGIDAKLKLRAQRAYDKFTTDFFATNEGIKTGVEVSISNTQTEDVVASLDGMIAKFSYRRECLTANLDYPTILNNFVHLFEWATWHIILTLPSYPCELGVMERLMMSGKENYVAGAAFRMKDQSSLLQMHMYRRLLQSEGIDIEAVISWFFSDYLRDEFGAQNLRFRPTSTTATNLEKCRHLFSEMESVLKQFTLFVENGELDLDLLSMSSEQLTYKKIPSTLEGKYVYVTDHDDIRGIQHSLFSDQSHLTYINEQLTADSLARLLVGNHVAYHDFADHQRPGIDFLISHGVLGNVNTRVTVTGRWQFRALKELWDNEAASYYHYPPDGRAAIDEMVAKGWLERRSSLLTPPEASYINYLLNQSDSTGGPDLRNRYLHGSQADGDDDSVHFHTYLIALRLLIALVIKLNDDLCLRTDETESLPFP